MIELLVRVRERVRLWRNVLNAVESDLFYEAYHKATPEQKARVEVLIANLDARGLVQIAREIAKHDVPIRELKDRARRAGVYGYSRMTKLELMKELERGQRGTDCKSQDTVQRNDSPDAERGGETGTSGL